MFTTYQDAVEGIIGYLGGSTADEIVRDSKRAVLDAYRELANAFRWSYLYHHGRIITYAPYGVGAPTIAYLHSGGAYPRQVTLTGGTWPAWAAGAYLRAGEVAYRVAEMKSAITLTLDEEVNPGADLPALTPFRLYQDTYLLPEDFIAQDQALYERNFGGMSYTHPRDWLFNNRYVISEGQPQFYTVTGDPQYPGRMVIRMFPSPDSARSVDFLYHRRPRSLSVFSASAGSVATTAGVNAIAGTGTAFTPMMVRSVIRIGADAKAPTGETGKNPAAFESVVTAWNGPTSLTIADAVPATLAGVGYTISDPIDIEQGTMLNAFRRCCEKHIGVLRIQKDKQSARLQYVEALEQAKSADSRSFMGRVAGAGTTLRRRMRDMPSGPDES